MEVLNTQHATEPIHSSTDKDCLHISCNWGISNNKHFRDAITTVVSSQEPEKTSFADVVSLDTCIQLQPMQSNNEPCMLEIKLLNRQRISCIAVVSEAYVLEFFKQFGEYGTTIFAEFVDEFEDNSVYFAETAIIPSATEASIKFTKTKNKTSPMWIYGIRLYLREPINETNDIAAEMFNPELIKNFFTKLSFNTKDNHITNNVGSHHKDNLNSVKYNKSPKEDIENNKTVDTAKCEAVDKNKEPESTSLRNEETITNLASITMYIDNKFHDLETRLLKRIEEMEQRTNEKLDIILKRLEA